MSSLICPICGAALIRTEKTYNCSSGHSYDIAKSGYVNLLPSLPGNKRHGDDKLMVRSRTDFLNKGYYNRLSDTISNCVCRFSPPSANIADAGCGEGKYTAEILQRLESVGKTADIIGIDISKDALICAAKRSKALTLCVASSASLPIQSDSMDFVLNIFSPFMKDEFLRVLKKGGHLLRVIPLEKHLWELKTLIYDNPYENTIPDPSIFGMSLIHSEDVCYSVDIDNSTDIMSLFMMTPYYYKTSASDQAKAMQAQKLTTQLAFRILVYEKD